MMLASCQEPSILAGLIRKVVLSISTRRTSSASLEIHPLTCPLWYRTIAARSGPQTGGRKPRPIGPHTPAQPCGYLLACWVLRDSPFCAGLNKCLSHSFCKRFIEQLRGSAEAAVRPGQADPVVRPAKPTKGAAGGSPAGSDWARGSRGRGAQGSCTCWGVFASRS